MKSIVMKLKRILGAAGLVAAVVALAAPAVPAQTFPNSPLELTVPWTAGSAPDAVARALAEGMSKHLGQQVIVVNRPGAGGAIGYKYVQSRKADGYTMVLSSNSMSTGLLRRDDALHLRGFPARGPRLDRASRVRGTVLIARSTT